MLKNSYGVMELNFSDAYGSSIELYLKKFGGYDVSEIEPDRNATI